MYFRDLEVGERFVKISDQQNELWEKTEADNGVNAKSILDGKTCFVTVFEQVDKRESAFYQLVLFPLVEDNKGETA